LPALRHVDVRLAARYEQAFDQLFVEGAPGAVIGLAEELLGDAGGVLFEGYRRDAPPDWRRVVNDVQGRS
jgi:hypothetical protein